MNYASHFKKKKKKKEVNVMSVVKHISFQVKCSLWVYEQKLPIMLNTR